MAPQTGTALLLIAIFVLPGFVTLLIRERTYRVKDQDSPFERLLNALYFSSIVYPLWVSSYCLFRSLRQIGIGRVVGGYFGEKSLAGYTTRTRDLFIEQRWILDDEDWFERPVQESLGLWISEDQINSIEVYRAFEDSVES